MEVYRGEIYFADMGPVEGSEQGGTRPVLVIQNNVGNHYSPTTIVAAITGQKEKNRLPTHVFLPKETSKLRKDSIVLLEQIRTISKHRLKCKMGEVGDWMMEQIDAALAVSIGFVPPVKSKKKTPDGGERLQNITVAGRNLVC